MGYGITPYRIDLQKITALYGSGNEALPEKLGEQLESLDEDFEPEDGWEAAEEILGNFLRGDDQFFEPEENSAKHWYILEMLMGEFGSFLANDAWYPNRNTDDFYDNNEFKLFMFDREDQLDLEGPDDFPTVFTVFRNDLDSAISKISAGEMEREEKQQCISWLEDAKKHGEDLVLYYY